jgi:phosphoenolpyruvate carboxykinase (GTP)
MLPFLGYNMGDYLAHWLEMGDTLRVTGRPPRIFQVNWFRRDADGRFIWPGFGENSRVVEWIVDRLEGRVPARHTAIGWTPQTINLEGLGIGQDTLEVLLEVDCDAIAHDLDDAEVFLSTMGSRLPAEISRQLEDTRKRLSL